MKNVPLSKQTLKTFVSVTPNLEFVLVKELKKIVKDLGKYEVIEGEGGVEFDLNIEDVWTIAHYSRVAEAIRVRIGPSYRAATYTGLRAGLPNFPWNLYLPFKSTSTLPKISVTCHKSALIHTGEISDYIESFLKKNVYEGNQKKNAVDPTGQIYVRIVDDQVQISITASGELLYKRTEGKHVSEAPLRETIAAGILTAANYKPERNLWDPFCGAGTIVFEAIGKTVGGAIPRSTSFEFERWRAHHIKDYREYLKTLVKADFSKKAEFVGSDIDNKAIKSSLHNVSQLGYEAANPKFVEGDFESVAESISPDKNFMIVSNLPYGHRVGKDSDQLADSVKRFSTMLKRRTDFKDVFVINGNKNFNKWSPLPWKPVLSFKNRGLPVQLLQLVR